MGTLSILHIKKVYRCGKSSINSKSDYCDFTMNYCSEFIVVCCKYSDRNIATNHINILCFHNNPDKMYNNIVF